MPIFLQKVGLFLSIIALYKLLVFAYIYKSMPAKHSEYEYYGQSTGKNKIVLIGSSNMKFNFNYEKLSKQFPNHDIIGCGLNEPSGLYATVYKLSKLGIEEGDKVIFCLPHSFYESAKFLPIVSDSKRGYSKAMLTCAFIDFPVLAAKSFISIKPWEIRNSTYITTDFGTSPTFAVLPKYQTDSLYLSCELNTTDKFHIHSTTFEKEHLKKVQRWLNGTIKGKVLFRFPAIKEKDYELDNKRIDFLIKNFKFINDLESSIYKKEFWFNQWYHLNKCGRDINTELLIVELLKS